MDTFLSELQQPPIPPRWKERLAAAMYGGSSQPQASSRKPRSAASHDQPQAMDSLTASSHDLGVMRRLASFVIFALEALDQAAQHLADFLVAAIQRDSFFFGDVCALHGDEELRAHLPCGAFRTVTVLGEVPVSRLLRSFGDQ